MVFPELPKNVTLSTEDRESRGPWIRYHRVFLGGLLGGVVSNVSGIALGALVLRNEAIRIFQSMEHPPSGTRVFLEHLLMRFGIGLAAAWLYAAILPRFGRGRRTILAAAMFLWLLVYLFPALVFEELRIYSTRTAVVGAAWGFIELVCVTAAAAWLYRDSSGSPEEPEVRTSDERSWTGPARAC